MSSPIYLYAAFVPLSYHQWLAHVWKCVWYWPCPMLRLSVRILMLKPSLPVSTPVLLSDMANPLHVACLPQCVVETLTISNFPYYDFENRSMAYTVGSAFYGICVLCLSIGYECDQCDMRILRSLTDRCSMHAGRFYCIFSGVLRH